jgi:hypothetical protein
MSRPKDFKFVENLENNTGSVSILNGLSHVLHSTRCKVSVNLRKMFAIGHDFSCLLHVLAMDLFYLHAISGEIMW